MALVVEGEPWTLVAHANRLPFDAKPIVQWWAGSIMFGRHILGTDAQRVIRRMQWVVAQDVLDVCDQQLLMLLFMLHAQL